ncbi:hypothetical protein M408DRAFT_329355 [Serendipita vermifera MAFF 305830]|uniref:Uncharacterized protein n=1 Tax=Serendipita vermifera MAFF 305830 TaxID=933852 RepID=A0A0C3AVM2_SERVB|nr:hypothetical protein M408DRAFT_329355 [Serendipita vermifera MAFF 305830]
MRSRGISVSLLLSWHGCNLGDLSTLELSPSLPGSHLSNDLGHRTCVEPDRHIERDPAGSTTHSPIHLSLLFHPVFSELPVLLLSSAFSKLGPISSSSSPSALYFPSPSSPRGLWGSPSRRLVGESASR